MATAKKLLINWTTASVLKPNTDSLPLEDRKELLRWWYGEFLPSQFDITPEKIITTTYPEIIKLEADNQKLEVSIKNKKLQEEDRSVIDKNKLKRLEIQIARKKLILERTDIENKATLQNLKFEADKSKIRSIIPIAPPIISSIRDYMNMAEKEFQDFSISIVGAIPNKSNQGSDGHLRDTSVEIKSGKNIGKKEIDILYSNMKLEGNSKGILIFRGVATRGAYNYAEERNIDLRHITEVFGNGGIHGEE